jgi:hypothetical protein
MKLFEMPYIDVIKFAVKDVIATSFEEEEDDFNPGIPGMNCI